MVSQSVEISEADCVPFAAKIALRVVSFQQLRLTSADTICLFMTCMVVPQCSNVLMKLGGRMSMWLHPKWRNIPDVRYN